MVQEKVPVWCRTLEDMAWEEKLHQQIDQAIRVHDKFLLVLLIQQPS